MRYTCGYKKNGEPQDFARYNWWLMDMNKKKNGATSRQEPAPINDHTNSVAEAKQTSSVQNYETAIVGVKFDNDDGTSRRDYLRRCVVGGALSLMREPQNKYDSNAVAVYTPPGVQVGYLGKFLAKTIAASMDAEQVHDCIIKKILRHADTGVTGCVVAIKIGTLDDMEAELIRNGQGD